MINKMYALHPHIPAEIISKFENAYGLKVEPIEDVKVITLCFKSQDDGFRLTGSCLRDYDSERNLTDTFFRNAPGMKVSEFPSLYVSEVDMKEDGVYSMDSKSYRKILRILGNNVEINPNLQGLLELFTTDAESIFKEVDKRLNNQKKTPFILCLEIDGLSIGRSPFYESVRAKAAEDYYKDFYTLDKKTVEGSDLVCSLCFEHKEKLWGYVSIYNFYTSKTELAPIAGGLNKELAHNNFPVCPGCAKKLKQVKPVIDQYFSFKFCGFDYFLVPEHVGGSSEEEAMDKVINIMFNRCVPRPGHLSDMRLGSFTLADKHQLLNAADEVFYHLTTTNNSVAYTMIFYTQSQSQFQLLSSVDDIFPSQFKEIFAAKEGAEDHAVFKDLPGKKGEEIYDLLFRFDLLREFLPVASRIEGDFSKSFLETTRSIFRQEPISYSFLLQRIVAVIRRRFTNDENYGLSARKAFLILKFLHNLGCIKPNKHKTQKEVSVNAHYEEFFTEHQDFFDTNAKKSVFMTGVMTQHLLDIQYVDRDAAPFRTRLNGLKLNPALMNRIFTEAREKLEQYGKNYYRELQSDIAQLMITGGLEDLSNDEISYFFTLGMTLNKQFKNKDQEETEKKE
ncbi:MAG: TIGR02556 family CRISPR-associated protein [Candidatus Cloacimonadaceae bacterium]|jgi:CRISPR-associated protein Csh1